MNKKKLLLLGGTRNMKEILDEAHAMGLWVGITDWYDTSRSPIKLLADEYFNVSITDAEAIDELIRDNGYDGVLTGYTDSYLETMAGISQRNGLPCYGTAEQFRVLTDKKRYKKLFQRFDVPALDSLSAERLLANDQEFPVLLKPAGGSGGQGLIIMENQDQLRQFVTEGAGTDVLEQYVIEPFIRERQEMTAFFLFIQGEVFLSGTADRFLSAPQGDRIGLPLLYSFPSSQADSFCRLTAPALIRMFKSLELRHGMLFAQCILQDGVPRVYDLGFRLTGTLEYKLFQRMYGFNPLRMLIRHALTGTMLEQGESPDIPALAAKPGYGFNATILAKPGTIGSIEGEGVLRKIPGVIDIAFKAVVGETIPPAALGTLGQIVARVFFTAGSLEEAETILQAIYKTLKVRDVSGQDMILGALEQGRLEQAYRRVGQRANV